VPVRDRSALSEVVDLDSDLAPAPAAPYLCRDAWASAASGLVWLVLWVVGGACARLLGWVWCARAPGLISVHGPGWLRVGDMMVDGVIPQTALRPLGLSGPSTPRGWRQEHAGSRPRCIGVMEGCARMMWSGGLQRLLAELAQRVVAALQQLARDRKARAIAAEALGGLGVVVAIR
jgi:hypothetical protein